MKVLILGSGVIGVSTAYYLAKSGHEVTVVDRRDGPGLETSYGNAGEVSPGYSSPWAAPKLVWKAVKWLVMKNRPLVIWPRPDPAMVEWGLQLGKQGGPTLDHGDGLGDDNGAPPQGCGPMQLLRVVAFQGDSLVLALVVARASERGGVLS